MFLCSKEYVLVWKCVGVSCAWSCLPRWVHSLAYTLPLSRKGQYALLFSHQRTVLLLCYVTTAHHIPLLLHVHTQSCNKVWESVLCHAEREGDERVFDNRLGKNGRVARFVYSTPFMGYMDDVFVAAFCSEDDQGDEQSELWFHSQSRVGSGDFGANYARVKSIIEAVDEGWSGCSWAELRA